MKHFSTIACLAPLAMLLAACNLSQNYGQQAGIKNVPNGVEGQWIDSKGMISNFHNGTFETRAPDTNEKLSEGNYTVNSPQLIALQLRSLVRGTVSKVNCALSNNVTKLQCTSQDGKQFTLTRKSSDIS